MTARVAELHRHALCGRRCSPWRTGLPLTVCRHGMAGIVLSFWEVA